MARRSLGIASSTFDTGNDQLVKPARATTDYLTRFSETTAAGLDPITTSLADVQTHLLTLIKPSGSTCTETFAPTLHRFRTNLPPSAWPTSEAGTGMAYTRK
ncbi:hypothetical protein EI94DRAFT_889557 [Lactarius quietus]|nr:hypothetical protein EI94DRAFT_889557 [Lactarius quietus]